jgi:hypothetical protein
LPDVRRADARSAQIGSPHGMTQVFQVNAYSGEPFTSSRARNLFSKDRCRLELADEMEKGRPEMPLILKPKIFACRAERLTRARPRPNWARFRPPGKSKGKWPTGNSCKEMALCVSDKVIWFYILNRARIDKSKRNVPGVN